MLKLIVSLFVLLSLTSVSFAGGVPPTLDSLQSLKSSYFTLNDKTTDRLRIRKDAVRDGALSFGARGGLAYRTWEIMRDVAKQEKVLDRVFDFKRLLVSAPSGVLIEPPVITESENAFIVSKEGQEAAVADRILNINKNVQIVTAPRDWRSYLERDWSTVEAPPEALLPKNSEEKDVWKREVANGWKQGVKQADEIFQADLDRLVRDFTGMIRYRILLSQGMVSAPYALEQDRGVTGGGNEMRIGDRAVKITGKSKLNPKVENWKPTNR